MNTQSYELVRRVTAKLVAAWALALGLCAGVQAATVSAVDVADTFIFSAGDWYGSPTASHGSLDYMGHCTGGWAESSNFLIKFNSLPVVDPATVTKVELVLNVLANNDSLLPSKVVAAAAFTEDATWATADAANQIRWFNVESGYAELDISNGITGQVSADVTTLAKSWLANPVTNNGFLILNYASGSWGYPGLIIATREYTTSAFQPQLIFTVPEPASLGVLLLGGLGLACRRRRK